MKKILLLDLTIGLIFLGVVFSAFSFQREVSSKSKRYFNQAFVYLLQVEGGYVNDPRDTGGETKFGVSKKSFPDMDIKNLTQQDAKHIYYEHYWKPCFHDSMSYKVAVITFDSCVHHGVNEGVKFLQKVLDLPQDGKLGPNTSKALAKVDQEELVLKLLAYRTESYQKIVSYKTYRRAWIKRLFRLAFHSQKIPMDEDG